MWSILGFLFSFVSMDVFEDGDCNFAVEWVFLGILSVKWRWGREGEGSAADVKAKERKERRPFRGKGEWVRQRWRERWENGHTLRERRRRRRRRRRKKTIKKIQLTNEQCSWISKKRLKKYKRKMVKVVRALEPTSKKESRWRLHFYYIISFCYNGLNVCWCICLSACDWVRVWSPDDAEGFWACMISEVWHSGLSCMLLTWHC